MSASIGIVRLTQLRRSLLLVYNSRAMQLCHISHYETRFRDMAQAHAARWCVTSPIGKDARAAGEEHTPLNKVRLGRNGF